MGTLHDRLHGRLWHTTHPDRFSKILALGCLSVNPDIPNSERWKAARPEDYPFVRHIGGISLFDFAGFDPERYERCFPLSNWYEFVPYRKSWGGAVWIEIDREAIVQSFLSAEELRKRWDQDGHRSRARMPQIEAAHIGDMAKSAFRSAFVTWAEGHEVRDIDVQQDCSDFDLILEEWRVASLKLKGMDDETTHKVVLAKRSIRIDLEYTQFNIEEGKTYLDDGTTVFDAYIEAGLKDGSFAEAKRQPDTITVSYPKHKS